MSRIALLGYGRMGQAIEPEAIARGHEITHRITRQTRELITQLSPDTCEVVIEFTHPEAFMDNLRAVMQAGLPMVTGTTGWHDRMDTVIDLVAQHEGLLIHASNFSIGVNLLFKLNQRLAELMNGQPQYDPYIEERHHRHKADGPSGTALTLSQDLLARLDRKQRLAGAELVNRPPAQEELSVGFVRAGDIKGTHRVSYTSDVDTLSIEHVAHNRRGFALGAVIAAEQAKERQGVWAFADLI
jgi:4-hydroxy-tetrahydrodipicolinate reductase